MRSELDRLLPAPIVTIRAAAPAVSAGGQTHVDVTLRVADGFHVMSDHPREPTYVPTTVVIENADGVALGAPTYPPSSPMPLGDGMTAR